MKKSPAETAKERIARFGKQEAIRSTEEHIRWMAQLGGGWQLDRQKQVLVELKGKQ